MQRTSQLYKSTVVRLGKEKMQGVENLLDKGCYGVAERHCVSKLFQYVESLEKQLGIEIPKQLEPHQGTIHVRNGNTRAFL